jgi:hypothetical protein
MSKLSLSALRREFSLYFRDMRDAARAEGYRPDRAAEWESFILNYDGIAEADRAAWSAAGSVAPRKVAAPVEAAPAGFRVTEQPEPEAVASHGSTYGAIVGPMRATREDAEQAASRLVSRRGGTFMVWEAGPDGLPIRHVSSLSGGGIFWPEASEAEIAAGRERFMAAYNRAKEPAPSAFGLRVVAELGERAGRLALSMGVETCSACRAAQANGADDSLPHYLAFIRAYLSAIAGGR